jgi:hypothetical protein
MSRHARPQGYTGLRRERLPSVFAFCSSRGLRLQGRGDWRSALCPFHDDKRASFSINAVTGGFVCHACGERGGDIIELVRRLDGLSFIEAAKELGAWETDPALRRDTHGI